MPITQVTVVAKLQPKDLRPSTRQIHRRTLRRVLRFLRKQSVRLRLLDRSRLSKPIRGDLIVTVGGDGTALAASHYSDRTPVAGINSAPQTSTGFFCLAGPKNFPKILKEILTGERKPKQLPRLEVRLNGRRLKPFGLNEVLFASRLQGETSRYQLRIGRRSEVQKSSGVWIATGAGSTGAIYSAGGKKTSPFAKKLQYFVREPCRFPHNHFRLRRGFVPQGRRLSIRSQMREGMLFIDGARWHYPIPKNGVIAVRGNVAPLALYL